MFSRKNLMKLLAIVGVMLQSGIVSAEGVNSASGAENYWVVGSYRDAATAQSLTRELEASQVISIRQQDVFIAGILHHRLLIAEMSLRAAVSKQLSSMGIKPWLMTLYQSEAAGMAAVKTEIPTPGIGIQQYLVRVGAFSRVDEAMTLERSLASAGLEVSGESKLAAGKVMHQVWVGPTHDLNDLRNRLETLGFAAGEVKPVSSWQTSARDTSNANRSGPQPVSQAPAAKKAPTQPTSNRYPQDFNLARLPEKRAQPLSVD
jgi:hypothetical protein